MSHSSLNQELFQLVLTQVICVSFTLLDGRVYRFGLRIFAKVDLRIISTRWFYERVNWLVILFYFLWGVVILRCLEVVLGVLKLSLYVKWKTIFWSLYETLLLVDGLTVAANKSIFV